MPVPESHVQVAVGAAPGKERISRPATLPEQAIQVIDSQQLEGECPACGGTEFSVLLDAADRRFATTDRVYHIVECRQCRLIRLHPPPDPSELARLYPQGYWEAPETTLMDRLAQWHARLVLRDHARFVERALDAVDSPGTILDVGCGTGLFLRTLMRRPTPARAGRKVAGLDFSVDAAIAAHRDNGVPAVCASLATAPFGPETCAVITMFQVLQHLYNPALYLDAAHRLLTPDGRLVIQVPNAACWQFLLMGERWSGLDVPRNLFHFRLSDLEALLNDCGFEIVRYKYFSLRDNPAGWASSLAPGLDPSARRLRKQNESSPGRFFPGRFFKDALYFALVAACVPAALLEAACRAGSTVMLEARKK